MTNKKKIFQLSLIFIGLIIIFFTYFFNLEKKQPSEVVTETETKENEEFLEEGVNRFENVEYKGIDNTGNKFTIGSQFAEFKKEKPELIFMENVECFFTFKDNTVLLISSKKGIYNNISNDMQFSEDVKMDYLENTIFSDRANFNNYENQLLIAGNVRGDGPTTNLKADELDFDLNTKDLKISMYSEERVKIKTKF
jgi:hypothetical protein|tara:strand:+ start:130 stop:717 length:588 start_codon:yes stop_codon:yes gene_type:complete